MTWRLTDKELAMALRGETIEHTPYQMLDPRGVAQAQARKLIQWLNDRAETLRYDRIAVFAVLFDRSLWDALLEEVRRDE